MTSEHDISIIQILRSMNERLGKIEQAVEPEDQSEPLITKRLIVHTAFVTLVTIGVYLGFTHLLGSLIDVIPS